MALFESSRRLIPNPLDVVEDGNCEDVPVEDNKARDYRVVQVEALAAELVEALAAAVGHSEPNALPLHAVKSAWESIKPGYAQRTDYTHLKKK